MRAVHLVRWVAVAALALPLGCGGDDEPPPQNTKPAPCSAEAQTGCAEGLVCEEVDGATTACFGPVAIRGRVFDAQTDAPIEGARVVARDANDTVRTKVAISAADGTYDLQVPARRDSSGKPLQQSYTLRADAKDYLSFPKPPRVALPVEIASATGDPLVVSSVATDIALIELPAKANLGSVSGTVHAANPGGTLVVAGTVTGVADGDGTYEVFNVPAGTVTVSGYAKGLQLSTETADVKAGQTTTDVDLESLGAATAVVSGSVQIVNAPGGAKTSVVLAVEETFEPNAARGEVPRGLRVGDVTGTWRIEGVPNGKYVVLAAFENDGLVRDPDTSIGGTEIVRITVSGADQSISQGFKVTDALEIFSPGGTDVEVVTGTPTFEWEDDSSEDGYIVQVFDAFGNETWRTEGNFDPGGSKPASVQYGGNALEPGMFYQFRATSMKGGVPISSTEDLKGVFVIQ